MAMVNLGNISAVTTQMLGNEIGGVVATGVSTLLQSGGSDSLTAALSQLEKFFGPEASGRAGAGSIANGPLAFSAIAATGGAAQAASLSNPFGATQGLQPKMQGLMEGLNQTLDQMLGKMGALGEAPLAGGASGTGNSTAEMAKQFEMVMDQAVKMHLSGNAGDGLKAQALFQKALGMLSGPPAGAGSSAFGGGAAAGGTLVGGGGFGAPVGGGGFGGFGASPASSGFAPSGGGTSGGGMGGAISGSGGGLDAMMSQAESLLRSDSMEAQLAGQRMMQKALRMFELLSKLIEKQSEMASKAIAAIK